MFIATRTLVAIGTAGCMQATSIWFLEHCDTKSRAKLYLITGMFFGVGYAIMPVYAYYIRDWSKLQLAFSLTTLSLLSFFWIFPESPRWLASRGRDDEAVKALERIARINGMPKPPRVLLFKAVRHCHQVVVNNDESGSMMHSITLDKKSENGKDDDETHTVISRKPESIPSQIWGLITNFKSLLSTKELRKISFTLWALFITVAFVYYGFAFSTNLTTNPFLLVSLGALMEIPASVLPIPFLSKWGRRPTTVACYFLTGMAALSIAITFQSR
ncbi:Organic cation transporter-like protein [Orchesella cincta]|uniref:Organic cation transporter-like protein n=1 Tax=Orchesella cincta TaxID=48709 RepID=A0A1D2MBJ7_ORCCI|nr:Organic cation transporter-like protein [Orchesella cincta]